MTIATVSAAAAQRAISGTRRELGRGCLETFARLYLGQHFVSEPSPLHDELFRLFTDAASTRGRRIAVAAPRGHAKTTVTTLAYALWCVLYGHDQFVLIVSETKEQAADRLRDLKRELETNPLLALDFPEACQGSRAPKPPRPWRDTQIVLRTGAAFRVMGAGQAIRGVKYREHRPTLIIVDDLEGQAQIESAEQRDKLWEWFMRTLLKAGTDRTNVVVVGTILHYHSVLARLTAEVGGHPESAGWTARRYRAVESFSPRSDLWDYWQAIFTNGKQWEGRSGEQAALEFFRARERDMLAGTSVLWPDRESYYQLMKMRLVEGTRSFQAEKQNEPIDPEQCLFSAAKFRYWDDEYKDAAALVAALGRDARVFGACDPSLGKRKGDFSAVITLVQNYRTKVLYVIGASIKRRTPDEIVEAILGLGRVYDFEDFMVESNQFQDMLAIDLERRSRLAGIRMRVRRVNNSENKVARISSLEALISQGHLRFSREHSELIEQLRLFPLGPFDDGPDALELAVTGATRHRGGAAMITT